MENATTEMNYFRPRFRARLLGPSNQLVRQLEFSRQADFERFLKNFALILAIRNIRPESSYQLAKTLGIDPANLNKSLRFLKQVEAIKLKKEVRNGRQAFAPLVDYEKICLGLGRDDRQRRVTQHILHTQRRSR